MVVPPVHKHWIIIAKPLLVPVVIALVIAFLIDVVAASRIDGTVRGTITYLVVGGTVLWAVGAWLVRLTATLTVTNQRVIQEEGVLRRSSNVIPVDRIQDISIKQSVVGRLLSYGDIEIDTAGVIANQVFTYLPEPEQLRDKLFVVSSQRRRPGGIE